MKKSNWMLAVLTVFFCTFPVFAQSNNQTRPLYPNLHNAIERAAIQALKQQKDAPTADQNSAAGREKTAPVCIRCGKEILSQAQHCEATGCTSLCTTQEYKPEYADAAPSVCPKCGKSYTIDEKYHGVKHVCQANDAQEDQAPVCCRCGKEILSQAQHCEATGCTSLCTTQEYKPEYTDAAPSVCPKCGKAYTIDEKYHGVKHPCESVEKDTAQYCIYCGEPIVQNNQKCTAAPGMDCTVRCPECAANLRDPKNVNAAGAHYCRFKVVIKPVKPHTGK